MPIGYAFVRRLACLDPVSIVTSSTQAASQFKLVIDHLVTQQHLEGCSCDELIRQYAEFVDCCWPNLLAFKEFNFPHTAPQLFFATEWQLPQVVGFDDNAADPLAWSGISAERVLYQPSGHGREPEGAVIRRTGPSFITCCTLLVWMPSLSTSHFYRQHQVVVKSTHSSTLSGNVQSLLKG